MDFNGKTAVITGGATGIGFAIAKALGAGGANIVIGEPRQDKLDAAVAALGALGITAAATVCDVRDLDSVEALADFAWDRFGQVDMLFNNAGIAIARGKLPDVPMDAARDLFDINFWGVWNGARVFGARMRDQGTPAMIYNTGSENSFFCAVTKSAAYIASKHAILGLTDALRGDMPDFVTVGLIIPGFVITDLTPGATEDMAMTADDFAQRILPQIKAGRPYVVSHAYNPVRIRPRFDELERSYAEFAPRYEGDEDMDVPTIVARAREAKRG